MRKVQSCAVRTGMLCLIASFAATSYAREAPPFFDASDLTPYWNSEEASHSLRRPVVPATVQTFQATNQDGKLINEKSMTGKIGIVSFFFAQCGTTCPRLMHSVQSFQSKIKKSGMSSKVRFYSFSVTPEQDTPQVLKDYGKERGFDLSNWMLLTGERDAIFRVGREIFKADRSVGAQKTPDSFIHSDNLYLLDQKLRIRGIYSSGSSKQVEYLAQDIRRLTEAVQ